MAFMDTVALKRIAWHLSNDKSILSKMCTVSKGFNAAFSPELYRRITISSVFEIRDVDRVCGSENVYYDKILSSCLPHNAPQVQEFEFVGIVNIESLEENKLVADNLENILTKYTSLRAFSWRPLVNGRALTHSILGLLPRILDLRSLHLKVTSEEKPFSIPPPELKKLRHLTLASPSPSILLNLPDALKLLDRQLLSLCLEDDCGSVTPGILASLLPISQGLYRFSLGVAYALKYDDIFTFISNLPRVQYLEVFHYPQLTNPKKPPKITSLRYLRITHAYNLSRKYTRNMCKWIRRLISFSSLECLEIICDDREENQGGPHISYDGLIDHLVSKHPSTLRILSMRDAFVGTRKLKLLMDACRSLEAISVSARQDAEVQLGLGNLLQQAKNIRSFHINIVNRRKEKFRMSSDLAESIMNETNKSLRFLSINDKVWEGYWTLTFDDMQPHMRFSVKETTEDALAQYAVF